MSETTSEVLIVLSFKLNYFKSALIHLQYIKVQFLHHLIYKEFLNSISPIILREIDLINLASQG